ncbi:hypothetical protein M1105_05415 [Limibaculum sp. FT325]|uniref:hypothetical protein n=1 Tax=Thermohalobaculum sediminis TaxID=2939436 RepID=UPI0020C07B01|nr:hypothetical protein [Limibaculum sediminis]MCL5776426.1 hypothetical protein [Limibaculum sediminis]
MENLRCPLVGSFRAESPFLDGHFVGNPIVPGAIILGFLAAGLKERGQRLVNVQRMKFIRPLRPDVSFEVTIGRRGSGLRAEFSDGEGIFATASLVIRPIDE